MGMVMSHQNRESREQDTLFPIMLDDLVGCDALIRIMDV